MFINKNVINNENASSKVRDSSSLIDGVKRKSLTHTIPMTLVLLETDDEAMQRITK